MPFRISFPCAVIFRTWRIVKTNCGGMAYSLSYGRHDFHRHRTAALAAARGRWYPPPMAVPATIEQSRAHTLAYAGLVAATVGWAVGFVAGKVALGAMSPLPVAAWRYAVAATILFPFAL